MSSGYLLILRIYHRLVYSIKISQVLWSLIALCCFLLLILLVQLFLNRTLDSNIALSHEFGISVLESLALIPPFAVVELAVTT